MYHERDKWTISDPGVKRALGDDPVPAKGHSAENVPQDYRSIPGWGVDLDPKNRPSYPKEYPSTVMNVRGDVGERQTPHVKVHQSLEHPDLPPVFGTSVPPHGLSGMMRDYAYQFSESSNRHWMTLIFADRVDMLEHLIGDVFRGKGDNYIAEKGWTAYWKYAPSRQKRMLTLGALALGAVAVGIAVSKLREDDDD